MSAFRSLLLSAALLVGATAHAGSWELDPAHSHIGFRVSHMMVSWVEGQFPMARGTLSYDPGDLSALSVQVTVDVESVETGNAKRDEHLRSSDFLAVDAHPEMRFVSRSVKARRGGGFDLTGDLTIRGVTRPVTFEAKGLGSPIVDPWGKERVGATATATIDRQDFGVSWNEVLEAGGVLVGDDLELRVDVAFTRPAGAVQN